MNLFHFYMPILAKFVISLQFLKNFASEFDDDEVLVDIESSSQHLMRRIASHDFCAANNGADFWLDHEEESLLAKDSFFVPCSTLDEHWMDCEDVTVPRMVNGSSKMECPYFGDSKGHQLYVNVSCRALPCIECHGARNFTREMPCKKYTGHYFLSALLYSIFLGLFAVDRFYLGYSAVAVGKLMTLGGLGVWWVVDIFLLLNGQLKPADDSEWQPFWR